MFGEFGIEYHLDLGKSSVTLPASCGPFLDHLGRKEARYVLRVFGLQIAVCLNQVASHCEKVRTAMVIAWAKQISSKECMPIC